MPQRSMPPQKRLNIRPLGFLVLSLFLWGASAAAQMKTGADMPGYQEAFGLQDAVAAKDYTVQEIEVTAGKQSMANVLWPGESIELTLRFTNKLDTAWKTAGNLEV